MPRPSLANQKRRELIPIVARVFAERGYRRTTTAELAQRCGVQENILYRLWPDKKAMFIAAIGHVYELAEATWARMLQAGGRGTSAERVLEYESKHLGEFGHSRIIFAGLSESDDPDIRRALARMYQRYQRFVFEQVGAHRGSKGSAGAQASMTAWALIGLGTVASITLELGLLSGPQRRKLMKQMGGLLLEGGE